MRLFLFLLLANVALPNTGICKMAQWRAAFVSAIGYAIFVVADSLHELAAEVLTAAKNIVNNFMTGDIGATRAFSHALSILYTRLGC